MRAVKVTTGKQFEKATKRGALELRRAQVLPKNISNQLQMSERTLRLILAFAKAHHMHPTIPTKPSTGRQIKINDDTIKYR